MSYKKKRAASLSLNFSCTVTDPNECACSCPTGDERSPGSSPPTGDGEGSCSAQGPGAVGASGGKPYDSSNGEPSSPPETPPISPLTEDCPIDLSVKGDNLPDPGSNASCPAGESSAPSTDEGETKNTDKGEGREEPESPQSPMSDACPSDPPLCDCGPSTQDIEGGPPKKPKVVVENPNKTPRVVTTFFKTVKM